ncbi:MAG: 30S ribosomal protein S6 [Thermodesulfobacteriota bacterium]|nr:30S ribosomal protein S6 [Thermodesulfobacteriota bacterium]
MRRYETIFIADPDLSPENQAQLFEKAATLIDANSGVLVAFDEWGTRRLAYEIRKKPRGHYVRLDYCGDGATVQGLENAFRIDERVLKFMTVFLSENADPEALRRAIAEEKEKKAEGQAAEDAAPADGDDEAPKQPETEAGPDETDAAAADKSDDNA